MTQVQVSPVQQCNSDVVRRFDDVLQLIGDAWTLRIIDALSAGELRFCELERALDACNPATLSKRLKRLEEAGILARHTETVDKQSVTYGLTEKGQAVVSVIVAIHTVADQHF